MMTLADSLRFSRLCHEELSRAKARESIGLLEEKRLHSVLKRWLCDDFSAHEQKIEGRGEKKRKFVADVLTAEGQIFEIQTGSLYPLQKKIAFYLEQTDLDITVVHPLLGAKRICWISPESGEIVKQGRFFKKEGLPHGIAALRYLVEHLQNPRFHVLFPVIRAEEFRLLDGWSADGKRGSHRYELIPTELLDLYHLRSPADYAACLPDTPPTFTASEFSRITHLRRYDLSFALTVFTAVGVLEKAGARGRATLYRRI